MADVRIKYKVDKGELVLARQELEKIKRELGIIDKEGKSAADRLGTMSKGLKGVAVGVAAAFTVDRLIDFGRRVVEVTAEFQRLQAVLTTTLGSRSQAQAAFTRLQQFASQTPFQVSALTDSFVRLANQGFVPTNQELRNLGDLAASTGKQFDQLTEAIIDAQVGEFERLKEFGIRASKEGENVTFAFKGVETQVAFTNEAIRDYLVGLGELEGVSGSMEAVSQTLGGQISNLEDSFDALFFAIGNATGGIISDALTALGQAVEFATRLINLANGISTEAAEELNKLNEEFADLESPEEYQRAIRTIEERIKTLNSEIENNIAQQALLSATQSDVTNTTQNLSGTVDDAAIAAKQASQDYADLAKELGATEGAADSSNEAAEDSRKTYTDLTQTLQLQTTQISVLTDFLEQLKAGYQDAAQGARDADKALIALSNSFQTTFLQIAKDSQDGLDSLTEEYRTSIDDIVGFILSGEEEIAKADEQFLQQQEDRLKRQEELDKESANRRRAIYEGFYAAVDLLGNEAFDREQARLDLELERFTTEQEERIAKLEAERDRQIELAGENASAREAIERQFAQSKEAIENEIAQKEKEIRRQQAVSEKRQALFEIAINTASAVVEALPNVALSIAAGVIGAIQAGIVASRPIPQFADGVLNLQGGVRGKDSIPALLMPGESVMTTAETRDFMPTLKAIRENRIDPALLNAVAEGKGGGSRAEIHNNIIEVPRDNVVWDEDGFSLYMHRKSSTVQKKGIRYKC